MARVLIRFFRQPQLDPLQVSMTGVRMGERFVLIGCDDSALLAGLGAKVGMSGVCAVVALDEHQAVRAKSAAARAGVLIELKISRDGEVPFGEAAFDMAVIDDTQGDFANRPAKLRATVLANVRTVLRKSGRIEVVEGLGSSGLFAKVTPRPQGYNAANELEAAGFKPVRVLAEVTSFRFVEGLRL